MFEPAQRGTTKEEFSHTPPPLHLQTCDDKQTWGYLLNQSWSRLKMKQVVAIVRICSSPVIVRIHSSPDTLSSLFQADPVQGRVRGKEAADHQLKLSCQETTMSPWLQIHHYSLTGTSKDWSRQPPAASHIPVTATLLPAQAHRLLHTGAQVRKAARLEASPLWEGRWQVFFQTGMFSKYYLHSVQKCIKKKKRTFLVSFQFVAKLHSRIGCTEPQDSYPSSEYLYLTMLRSGSIKSWLLLKHYKYECHSDWDHGFCRCWWLLKKITLLSAYIWFQMAKFGQSMSDYISSQ